MGKDFNQAGLIFISADNEAIYTNTKNALNARHDHNGNDSLIVADDSCYRTLNINYSVTCNTFCDKSNACQSKIMDQSKDSYGVFSIHTIWNRGCASLLAHHRYFFQHFKSSYRSSRCVKCLVFFLKMD